MELENYLIRLLELRHMSYQIDLLLRESLDNVKSFKDVNIVSASQFILSDWTIQPEKGWTVNRPSGISKKVYHKDYESEVQRIVSSQCCYSFAQGFEALESFCKNLIVLKAEHNLEYRTSTEKKRSKKLDRNSLSSQDLFDLVKVAGGKAFIEYSRKNFAKIRFKEFWTVISDSRHAITHSNSFVKQHKVFKTSYYEVLYRYLFHLKEGEDDKIELRLDYHKYSHNNKIMGEFAFLVFKSFSESENLEWKTSFMK